MLVSYVYVFLSGFATGLVVGLVVAQLIKA